MDEMMMQKTQKTTKLKLFSKEVYEFIKYYKSQDVIGTNILRKDFSACRLLVISNSKIDKYGAIDYISGFDNIYLLQFENCNDTCRAYLNYIENPDVLYVEPDKFIELINSALLHKPKLRLYEANYNNSWGYDYIETQNAFNYILQDKTIDELPRIVVGVIDSGVDTENPILKNRLLETHSFVEDSAESDKNMLFHGTKVSSILIENTLENVKFISYKIFSECDTALSILRLAEMQAEIDGVDLVNSSYGMLPEFDTMLKKPLQIAAAGNYKTNLPQYPAACKGVVSVTGITKNGVLSDTSTYGDWVEVAAPSEDVRLSDLYYSSKYKDFNGTSCAAPFVTAICAMIKTQYPYLSNDQIKRALFNSCTKADMPIKHGIVNMYNAVRYFDKNKNALDEKKELVEV